MNELQLDYFCQTQSILGSLCIRIYEDDSLKNLLQFYGSKYDAADINNIPLNMTIQNFQTDKSIAIFDETQFMLGYIKDEGSGKAILIGPIRMGEIASNDISALLTKYGFPKILKDSISHFLYSTPVIPMENFLVMLSMFNLVINGSIVTMQQIMHSNSDILSQYDEKDYIETIDIEMPRAKGDYEATVAFYIKNGMLKEIESLEFEQFGGQVGKLGPNYLRSMKNALIILNSICLRAAISGGLDTETAYALGERYAQRIENAASIPELGKLSPAIRKDYCQRVKNLIAPKIDNLHVLKVTKYIQNNIYTKITVQTLSEVAGVSPEYLANISKQHLKCTLSEYINKAKITEAKKLLRFTNKSLSEISQLLCYSSQSHFQNQFKKIRGLTPTKYREKYQVVKKKDK